MQLRRFQHVVLAIDRRYQSTKAWNAYNAFISHKDGLNESSGELQKAPSKLRVSSSSSEKVVDNIQEVCHYLVAISPLKTIFAPLTSLQHALQAFCKTSQVPTMRPSFKSSKMPVLSFAGKPTWMNSAWDHIRHTLSLDLS